MKPHKIFYVPGLISAILIPLLFWYYGSLRIQPTQYAVVLGLPARHIHSEKCKTSQTCFESFRNWNYQKIIVKPNTAKQNINYYISEIKKLQKRNQKETGIEFLINKENTLQDFISLLDAMEISKQEHYGVDLDKTDHFFALHFYKNPNKIERGYDVFGDDTIDGSFTDEHYLKGYQKFQYQLSHLPKQVFYLIFGYLFLLQVSVLSLIRKYI